MRLALAIVRRRGELYLLKGDIDSDGHGGNLGRLANHFEFLGIQTAPEWAAGL